ncbi:phage tail protein [Yersinia kristensenii]|uniref:phage tail protein n=1 Tax=Yersinia kristensenii TaxID=28152 RepID=UPI0028531757|nr:phage tail protein [Yersinia kristensenii]MDR4896721.1 phage tail protein [Yersinia kristensenii]MDX6735144.1 phage tail protein [Yersinia kristensenii]
MSNYVYSPSENAFIPVALESIYVEAGTWPEDGYLIADDEASIFMDDAPKGKVRAAQDGRPCWVDIETSPPSNEVLSRQARGYRDLFITATDPVMVSDYSIDDAPLTAEQRSELTKTRLAFKQWPTQEGWPLIELPELSQWLLVEAVNQGYIVPTWPPAV